LNNCNQFENLEVLYYPEAPNTSIICSTGEMTAVLSKSIKTVIQDLAPSQVNNNNFPICLIQYYFREKQYDPQFGNSVPFLFHFGIEDHKQMRNHGLICSSQVYCSICHKLMHSGSVSRHLHSFHENREPIPPYFSKTYQLSQFLYWQIQHQISHNAIHSPILRFGIWGFPPGYIWDQYYNCAYECTKAVIIHEIEIAKYVSIYIDGWTNTNRFEGIRLSFYNYGTLISRFLSMMFLEGKAHSAENIAHAIQELDKEYQFLKKTIWFVSDCASVNLAIAKILNIQFVPCGVHRYMICFENFDDNCWLTDIITWLSSLVKFPSLHDQIAVNKENRFSSLLSFSDTRWMYRYQMIERGVQCKQEILKFLKSVPTEELQNRFAQMQEFLDAFSEYNIISKQLQEENLPIHKVFLLLCRVIRHTKYLISEFDSGKLQFLGEINPFVELYESFHSRFFEDSNWSNFLIESFLLNGKFQQASWLPEVQYIQAAEEDIKESIGEYAFQNEYLQFRIQNPDGVNDPFSFWFNSPFKVLSPIAQKFLILIGTNCKLESDFSKAGFILSGRSALSPENFDKRAVLKLNEDVVENLLVFKTPDLLNSLFPNEKAAYQMLKKFNMLDPAQHPFPDPAKIKEKYGELMESEAVSYLELLTNFQRKLQYGELSKYINPMNNASLAIPTKKSPCSSFSSILYKNKTLNHH